MDAQPSQDLRQLIQKVSGGATLTEIEIRTALDQMTAGAATPAQMGAFLMALRVRGETVEEIAGAAQMLRAKMNRVEVAPDAIDIVGTGGDAHGTYNISTCAVADRGRRRREDRQARQPPRLLQVGRLRRAHRARRQARGAARDDRALRRRGGRRLPVGAAAPPRAQALGADPRRARHPHHLQSAGPDLQSGRRQAPGRRRVLLALGGAHRPRA